MRLYDDSFCQKLLYGSWDSGIINNLKDAQRAIEKNFGQMDLENASVQEEMEEIIEDMVREIERLASRIESVNFR